MPTRTHTLTNTLLNLDTTPRVGVPISVYLLTPSGLPVTDLEGGVLFNGQQFGETTVTNSSGVYSETAVYTGDLLDGSGNPLTTPCQLVVVEGGVPTLSPLTYAYASSITVSTWYPIAVSAAGMPPMLVDLRLVSNAARQGASLQLGISATAIAPNGTTLDASQSVPVVTDSGGDGVIPLWPTSLLNPTTTAYSIRFPDGTIWYFTAPVHPTGYQGAYAGGTTYNPNAGTKASPADVVLSGGIYYQCIATTTGHTPPNATYWIVWPGEPIVWNITMVVSNGGVVIDQTGISADTSVATGTYTVPPATLQDQLRQLTQIQARHVTANYTAVYDDDVIDADGTSNTVQITLPTAVGFSKLIAVKAINITHAVTITTASAQTIDGAAPPLTPALHTIYVFYSDGLNWQVYATNGAGGGSSLELTDGTHDLTGVTKVTTTNMTVGGTSPNATLTPNSMVASGSSHAPGIVPDPGASSGTTHFLREDATWAVPPGGSSTFVWTPKTANYTITTSDSGIAGDATSGNITITAPDGTGLTQRFAVKKVDATVHTVTLTGTGGQTFDGSTSLVFTVLDQGVEFGWNGTNWYLINALSPSPTTTLGDTLLAGSGGTLARFGIGATGQVPTVSGGTLVYATPIIHEPVILSVSAGVPDFLTLGGDIVIL